jgi:hypothetical protein
LGFRFWGGLREGGEHLDGRSGVVQPGVGVAVHRQGDGAVAGQRLRLLRLHPVLDEPGDEGVPQGMEIGASALMSAR